MTYTIEEFSNEIEGEYDAFFYLIDGEKIYDESFIPNSLYEILMEAAQYSERKNNQRICF